MSLVPSLRVATDFAQELFCLMRDVDTAAVPSTKFYQRYHTTLGGMKGMLTALAADPALDKSARLLWRYVSSDKPNGPDGYLLNDLRAAARTVYDSVTAKMDPVVLEGIKTSLAEGSYVAEPSPRAPAPGNVHQAFNNFSPSLQAALRGLVKQSPKLQFAAAKIEWSASLLCAALRRWLPDIMVDLGPVVEALDSDKEIVLEPKVRERFDDCHEILSWLATTPPDYSYFLLQQLAASDKFEKKEKMGYLYRWVEAVNRVEGTAFVIDLKKLPVVSGKAGSKHSLYYLNRAVADPVLAKRFAEVVEDEALRAVIVAQSGQPEAILFRSNDALAEGLTRAVVRLNPIGKPGLKPEEVRARLRVLVGVLELFLSDPPVLEQKSFFYDRLVDAGVEMYAQRALLERINRDLGADYRLVQQVRSGHPRLSRHTPLPEGLLQGQTESDTVGPVAEGAAVRPGVPDVLRRLLRDMRDGKSRSVIFRTYRDVLQQLDADLREIGVGHPDLREEVDRLHRFAFCKKKRGSLHPMTEVREAAEKLLVVVESKVGAVAEIAFVGDGVDSAKKMPTSDETQQAYACFSAELRGELEVLLPVVAARQKGRGAAASLDRSPYLLRAVVSDWWCQQLDRLRDPAAINFMMAKSMGEVLRWLSKTSPYHVDSWIDSMGHRRSQYGSRRLLRTVMVEVNRHLGTDYELHSAGRGPVAISSSTHPPPPPPPPLPPPTKINLPPDAFSVGTRVSQDGRSPGAVVVGYKQGILGDQTVVFYVLETPERRQFDIAVRIAARVGWRRV